MDDRIIRNSASTLYNNALIPEPSAYKKPKRVIRLVVDSRERNATLFPSPNSYEVNVLEDVQNVEMLSLLTADFPFDPYTIGMYNNALYVAYAGQVFTVSVEIGNYEPVELANAMQNAVNAAVGAPDFVVAYSALKDNFVFRCKNAFGLVFRGNTFTSSYNNAPDTAYCGNSIGKRIGFGIHNYLSAVQNTGDAFGNVISSEFKKDFVTQEYAILNIDAFELNKSTASSLQNSFAVVTKRCENPFYGLEHANKTFKPNLGKLSKLRVKVTDFHGNPFDFQNKDHRFELLLMCDF
jgi:hypothetical protein